MSMFNKAFNKHLNTSKCQGSFWFFVVWLGGGGICFARVWVFCFFLCFLPRVKLTISTFTNQILKTQNRTTYQGTIKKRFSFSVESCDEGSYNGWSNLMGCCCCQKGSSLCSFLLLLWPRVPALSFMAALTLVWPSANQWMEIQEMLQNKRKQPAAQVPRPSLTPYCDFSLLPARQ